MDESPILTERRDGYRIITLNRPKRLNAFTIPMHQVLAGAVADAEQDKSCRALLITGAGRAFSSGQDLNERVTADGDVVVGQGAHRVAGGPHGDGRLSRLASALARRAGRLRPAR